MSAIKNEDIYSAVLELKGDVGVMQGTLTSVEAQTKLTNGRVNKHDRTINYIIIALAVLVVALVLINPQLERVIKLIPVT